MSRSLELRDVAPGDLSIYFGHQRDPVVVRMAAFNEADPDDRSPLDAHWARVVAEDAISVQSIPLAVVVIGHLFVYGQPGNRKVSHWVGREHWGQGIATAAPPRLLV